jgi:hypothetical protein
VAKDAIEPGAQFQTTVSAGVGSVNLEIGVKILDQAANANDRTRFAPCFTKMFLKLYLSERRGRGDLVRSVIRRRVGPIGGLGDRLIEITLHSWDGG